MIKQYLETRKLKKREREVTARLDELWLGAKLRRDEPVNTDKWRDTRDFLKKSEELEYDQLAGEQFVLAQKLGIESPHFDPKRHDPMGGGAENSPKAMVSTNHYHPSVVTYKEEDGFFVMYRDGVPDPEVAPVPVEEWNTIVVDVDDAELYDTAKLNIGTKKTNPTEKYPT